MRMHVPMHRQVGGEGRQARQGNEEGIGVSCKYLYSLFLILHCTMHHGALYYDVITYLYSLFLIFVS